MNINHNLDKTLDKKIKIPFIIREMYAQYTYANL